MSQVMLGEVASTELQPQYRPLKVTEDGYLNFRAANANPDTAKTWSIWPEVFDDYPTADVWYFDTFTKGMRGWNYHNQANNAILPNSPSLSPFWSQRGQSLYLGTNVNGSTYADKTWARKGPGTPMIPQNAKKIIIGYEWGWHSAVDLYGMYRVNFTLDTQLQANRLAPGKRRWNKISWLNSVGSNSNTWHRKWQYDSSFADTVPGTSFNNAGFLFANPAGTITVNGSNYEVRTKANFANNEATLFQDAGNTGQSYGGGETGWLDIPGATHDFCYNEQYKMTFGRMAMVLDCDRENSIAVYEALYSHGEKFDMSNLTLAHGPEFIGEYLNFYENGINVVLQVENRGIGSRPQSCLAIDAAFMAFVY